MTPVDSTREPSLNSFASTHVDAGKDGAPGVRSSIRRSALGFRNGVLAALFIVTIGYGIATSDVFLTRENWLNIAADLFVELAFVSLAQMLVLVLRGIDLSVGGTMALTVVVAGYTSTAWGVPIGLAALLGLAAGAMVGLLNGLLVAYGRLPPMIVTLGSGILAAGLALGLSHGKPYSGFPKSFLKLGAGKTLGLPNQLYILAIVAAGLAFVVSRTVYGRWFFAAGGNEQAARYAGIPVARLKLLAYLAAAVLASIAALVLMARLGSANADTGGLIIVLQSITAAVLGGVSIEGGRGNVLGVLLAVLSLGLLFNVMTLNSIASDTQRVIVGLVLILSVAVDSWLSRRRVAA